MSHQQRQAAAQKRFSELTKARAMQKDLGNLRQQRFNCQMDALHMTMRTGPCALLFSRVNASSRGHRGNDVLEVTTSAIKRDASVQSLITFAPIQTDSRRNQVQFHPTLLHNWMQLQFHRIRPPCLWKFVLERGPFLKQLYKLD